MVMEAGASSSEKGNAAAMEIAEAQRLFDDGCDFMRNESFDDAAQCFSQALEYRYAVESVLALCRRCCCGF